MALELVEDLEVNPQEAIIKFGVSIKPSTLSNANFVVTTAAATPATITNPFQTISIADDYNSISRVLTLVWTDDKLVPDTDYILTITGVKNVLGITLADHPIRFTTGAVVNNLLDDLPAPSPVTTIVDYSIISSVFDNMLISGTSQSFQIDSTDPVMGDFYLEPTYHNGRVTIKFTESIDSSYANSTYFRAQRREVKRGPSRWEDVVTETSADSNRPWVYVDFPSLDHYPELATPSSTVVYYTSGYSYFAENYKYRIIVSKDITT